MLKRNPSRMDTRRWKLLPGLLGHQQVVDPALNLMSMQMQPTLRSSFSETVGAMSRRIWLRSACAASTVIGAKEFPISRSLLSQSGSKRRSLTCPPIATEVSDFRHTVSFSRPFVFHPNAADPATPLYPAYPATRSMQVSRCGCRWSRATFSHSSPAPAMPPIATLDRGDVTQRCPERDLGKRLDLRPPLMPQLAQLMQLRVTDPDR